MPDNIPTDVRKQLEDSGLSFDADGQIIEDSFTSGFDDTKKKKKPVVEVKEDEDEDEDITSSENDNQDDEDDEDENKDENDEDEDEDEDDEPPVRSKKTISLTPRKKDEEDVSDDKITSKTLKVMQEEMLERINSLAKDTEGKLDEEAPSVKELRAEAQKFQKMRIQLFAKEVESDVNSLDLGAKFKDIITSQEWRDYLNSNILGTTIGTLYVDSVKENDSESVVGFFEDFTARFLPSVARSKKVSKTVKEAVKSTEKPSLDDLSVPNRSKTSNSPRKASKYDYKESDYGLMLDKAERGKITSKEFNEFDTKFNASLSKGRVDTNS